MNTRREFLKKAIAGGAIAAASPLLFCENSASRTLGNFGFISGILRKELEADWQAALRQAASFGFTEYEGGLQGESPQEFLDFCRDIGLTPVAGGIEFSEDMAVVQESMDKIKALDMPYAITYWPWFSGGPFMLEDCKKSADVLNKMGELAKENGLTFCWHNHNKEFHEMEDGLPFDYLMAHTDENLVKCEMDIYWVKKGGSDPLEVLKKIRRSYSHFTCQGHGAG